MVISNNYLSKDFYTEYRLCHSKLHVFRPKYYYTNIWTKPIRFTLVYLSLLLININIFNITKLTNTLFFSQILWFFLYKRTRAKND